MELNVAHPNVDLLPWDLRRRAAALLAAPSHSFQIAQPFFIFTDLRRDGSIRTLFRIDRVFANLPMAELRDFQCHSHTIGAIGDKSVPSDHIPVRLAIECPRWKQQDHPVSSCDGLRNIPCSPVL